MECVDFGSLLSARDRWKVFWTVFWPFPKILYWADFDLMESIFIYIFVNGNKKITMGIFFLDACSSSMCCTQHLTFVWKSSNSWEFRVKRWHVVAWGSGVSKYSARCWNAHTEGRACFQNLTTPRIAMKQNYGNHELDYWEHFIVISISRFLSFEKDCNDRAQLIAGIMGREAFCV